MAFDHITSAIDQYLTDDAKRTALEFVQYLHGQGLSFYKDTGACWKDKRYYWVTKNDECVCFIAIKDPDEPQNQWTVWSDESIAYEDAEVCDKIKQIGWNYIDFCGKCGSCSGGKDKMIFGKRFQRVCGCTFRVDNAGYDDLDFLKTMVDIRIRVME